MTTQQHREEEEEENIFRKAEELQPPETAQRTRPPHPLENATFLGRMVFTWPWALMKLGLQQTLVDADLPNVAQVDSSEYNHDYMYKLLRQKSGSLHWALFVDFLKSLWYVQPAMGIAAAARILQAVALGHLLESLETGANSWWWASVLVFCGAITLFEHHHVFLRTWRKGMQLRIASIAAMYSKSLKLPSTYTTIATGNLINICTNDVERFLMSSLFISFLFWSPVQALGICVVGWWVIGPAFVAGCFVLVVVYLPIQSRLSHSFGTLRSQVAAITDERVTLVSQAVAGARVMKMNAWEHEFSNRIAAIRKQEVAKIQRANLSKSYNETIFFSANLVISMVVFLVHVLLLEEELSPRLVFTTMTLVNVIQIEMTKHVSLAIMGGSEVWVAIRRIQNVLELPQLIKEEEEETATKSTTKATGDPDAPLISMQNVTCYWNKDDPEKSTVALQDVSLELRPSCLVCVIGTVGSGKSALLQALVGELPPSSGKSEQKYHDNDDTATFKSYAAQDSWIMDGSIRENILLGLPFDKDWYNRVVQSCGLTMDLRLFQHGDQTLVGDRGVQCSGGQRARIGLARALYRDANLVVLDDPLSAVDAKVGRNLFYEAIVKLGVERGKCVVLATHQHQFIDDTTRCILMQDGKIACDGSYSECVASSGGTLSGTSFREDKNIEQDGTPTNEGAVQQTQETLEERDTKPQQDDRKEMNVTGLVRKETFVDYAKAMGGVWVGFAFLGLFTVTQASSLATIAAVGQWGEVSYKNQSSLQVVLPILGLTCLVLILTLFRSVASFLLTTQASRRLHDGMTESVVRAKIEFFDTNPMGRILNRFSADVGSNDDMLPHTLFDFLSIAFLVVGAIITTCIVLPFTLIAMPPLLWYFWSVRNTFVTTTRELKRLEGLARSPIFALMSESLAGIATIRANHATDYVLEKFREAHDRHTRAFFAFVGSSRWVGFRMDSIMFLFLLVASYLAVLFNNQGWFRVEPAILGLSLTMLLQLGGIFQWCIRQSAEVINQMVSVERVLGFTELPSEAPLSLKEDPNQDEWPTNGRIEINNLTVRYRESLPPSLKNLSLVIEAGHRVGVVGRTGSGKSTLVQSLFRLLEPETGSILLDGVDVTKMGLHCLRHALSVIPQVPVLYRGVTIAENLDPFGVYSEEDLHAALRDAHMLDAVLELGLNHVVAEGGSNFSVGQRQLLCLARAMLRKHARVLVLDEPTANVDSQTDAYLQEAITKRFSNATIIAVAHRLDTVIDYDRILVLGEGRVLEYGSPAELLENPNGHFSSMVHDTGMGGELRRRAMSVNKKSL